MSAARLRLMFLNLGHTYDHLFMLLYATAVLAIEAAWGLSYGQLIALATPGFIAFGAGAVPAGWLGDRWSRNGMMAIFFIGIGAASMLTGLARNPVEIGVGLFLIGLFASIYHPVGIAMVSQGPAETLGWRLGVNGVYGNMGVAGAALVAGALAQWIDWRAAFLIPGAVSIATGIGFCLFLKYGDAVVVGGRPAKKSVALTAGWQRVLVVMIVATLFGGLIFNATTISLPKVFDERMAGIAGTAFGVGVLASIVYAIAAFIQIVVGRWIDRHPIRPVFVWLSLAQVGALLLASVAGGWAIFFVALAVMFLVFGQIPIGDALIARYTPDMYRARIYSIKYVISLGVASLAVPTIAFLHGFGGGFATLFMALAGCAVVVSGAALAMPGGRPAPVPVPAE